MDTRRYRIGWRQGEPYVEVGVSAKPTSTGQLRWKFPSEDRATRKSGSPSLKLAIESEIHRRVVIWYCGHNPFDDTNPLDDTIGLWLMVRLITRLKRLYVKSPAACGRGLKL